MLFIVFDKLSIDFEISPWKPKGLNEKSRLTAENASSTTCTVSALHLFIVCQSLKSISPMTAGKLVGFKSKTSQFIRVVINAECCKEVGSCCQITSASAFQWRFLIFKWILCFFSPLDL